MLKINSEVKNTNPVEQFSKTNGWSISDCTGYFHAVVNLESISMDSSGRYMIIIR